MPRIKKKSPDDRDYSYIDYKIKPDHSYIVFRQEYNGGTHYKIPLIKTNANGEKTYGYKEVKFKKGISLDDRSIIVIRKAFEDFYVKNKNTITLLCILEFDLRPNKERETENALNNYRLNLNNSDYDIKTDEYMIENDDDDLNFW